MKIVIDLDDDTWVKVLDGYVPLGIGKQLKAGIPLPKELGKCDRCGGEIYPNTLCIECNDYLAKSVFAEEIKQEIYDFEEEVFHRPNTDYEAYASIRHCLDIIDNHLKGEQNESNYRS